MIMCRRAEKKIEPADGLPTHRHFVWFFNMPVQASARGRPFYGYSEKPPYFSRLFRRAWGQGGHILLLQPRFPRGSLVMKFFA